MSDPPIRGAQQRRRIEQQLVPVLERTRLMRDPASRQTMLDQLQRQLGTLVAPPERSQLRLQLVEIVTACTRVPGGVSAMIKVVCYLEPETREAHQLRQLQDEWEAAELIGDADWPWLQRELSNVSPPDLTGLYRWATQDRSPGPPAWCQDAWQVFLHLAGQNSAPAELPPHQRLLFALCQTAAPNSARSLQEWNRQKATELGKAWELDALDPRSLKPESQEERTAYLTIQLEPYYDPDQPGRLYLMSYWRQWQARGTWHYRPSDSVLLHRDQVTSRVEGLITHVMADWRYQSGPVVIEFLLPFSLLNADVGWWPWRSATAHPTVLAMEFPVVVRSLDRLRTYRGNQWRDKWLRIRNAPHHSRSHVSRPTGEHYFTRLEAELRNDDVVSLVLSEPPGEDSRTARQEVKAALLAGVPVIVWHRVNCQAADFQKSIQEWLGDLADLPMRARQLRLEALRLEPDQQQDHIGRHLAVLWCDPERRPDPTGFAFG